MYAIRSYYGLQLRISAEDADVGTDLGPALAVLSDTAKNVYDEIGPSGLADAQRRLAEETGDTGYAVETPIVYNRALDDVV